MCVKGLETFRVVGQMARRSAFMTQEAPSKLENGRDNHRNEEYA